MAVMLNYVQRLQRSCGQKVDSAAAAADDDDGADGHLFNGAVCKERVKGSKFLEVLR